MWYPIAFLFQQKQKHLSKKMRLFYLLLICLCFHSQTEALSPFEITQELPAVHQGRFHPLSSISKLWLYDLYHQQQLKTADLPAFHTDEKSSLDLIWRIHFSGHSPWDNAPLFWVHYAESKSILGLNAIQDRFSFNELSHLLNKDKENELLAVNIPSIYRNELLHLLDSLRAYANHQKISSNNTLTTKENLSTHLQQMGPSLKMLPLRHGKGDWISLHALKLNIYDKNQEHLIPVSNFTAFSDSHFQSIRSAYIAIEAALKEITAPEKLHQAIAIFTEEMEEAYSSLAGTIYKGGKEKKLFYPSQMHLKAETWYYSLPLIEIAIASYAFALLLAIAGYSLSNKSLTVFALSILLFAFLTHTAILTLRCYILQRPPVSNMFETVIYVPWIAMLVGSFFYFSSRSTLILFTGALSSLALLIILKLTLVDARLENVQAVLDSQYWLIVHVLMIVASYGAFVLSGLLGHLYLLYLIYQKKENITSQQITQAILHTMYIGVALLIPGTILGGVWAAESWGRFWDWDPKESWAFISACVYLLVIHSYTFHRVKGVGLAVGAVAGLMAISFTWYGVNYILGVGLHSYGFGTGGERYYFAYLVFELLFLIGTTISIKKWLFKENR